MIGGVDPRSVEEQTRTAAMEWLAARSRTPDATFTRAELMAGVSEHGRRVALMDLQRGIRKPAGFAATLAITTTYTPPGQRPPYEDEEGPDAPAAGLPTGPGPAGAALRRVLPGQLSRPQRG